jgi:hypothetical protein
MVNKMVKEKESEVSLLLAKLEKSEQDLNSKKVEQVEMQAFQTYIPVWREVFKKASTAKKKMMLSTIIECVRVYRDSVELTLKISSFLATACASSLKVDDLNVGDNVLGKALSHHTNIEQN